MNAELTSKPSHMGLWWVPGRRDEHKGGMLSWSEDDGLSLQTIGSFSEDRTLWALTRRVRWPLLHGIIHDVGQVTLTECARTGSKQGPFDEDGSYFSSERYVARMAFTHLHASTEAELSFSRLRLSLSRLAEWTVGSDIAVVSGGTTGRSSVGNWPARMDTAKVVGGRAALMQLPYRTHGWHESTAGYRTLLCIELEHPLHVDGWLSQYVAPLQDLLTLATGEPNRVEDIRFDDVSVFATEPTSTVSPSPVGVLYSSSHPGVRAERSMHPESMLLRYRDLPRGSECSINNWLNASQTYDNTFNLYFSGLHSPKMFAEQRYLGMVQAAEAYHRRKHGKRTDLKQRIQQLACRFREPLRPLTDDPLEFAVRVYNTRNYYAHYDKESQTKAAKGHELQLLSQHVSYLVRACLLAELGFSNEALHAVFARSPSFRFLASETVAMREQGRSPA